MLQLVGGGVARMKQFAGLASDLSAVRSITNVVTVLMIDINLETTVLWDVTPYSVVVRYHRSGNNRLPPFQGRKVTELEIEFVAYSLILLM
jgi:hypothetical protein